MELLSDMGLLSPAERVVARILAEMDRQVVSCAVTASRMGGGWAKEELALRLGLLVRGRGCRGKTPLSSRELELIAGALDVPVARFTSDVVLVR